MVRLGGLWIALCLLVDLDLDDHPTQSPGHRVPQIIFFNFSNFFTLAPRTPQAEDFPSQRDSSISIPTSPVVTLLVKKNPYSLKKPNHGSCNVLSGRSHLPRKPLPPTGLNLQMTVEI